VVRDLHRLCRGLDLSRVGDVGREDEVLASKLLDLDCRGFEAILAAGEEGDLGSVLREQARGGAADSAGCTGDDDDVAPVFDLPTRRRSQTCLPVEHLDRVAVAQLELPADLLPGKAGRRPPDPRAGAARAQLVVNRVGNVENRRRRG
jgi:hypothetical protein